MSLRSVESNADGPRLLAGEGTVDELCPHREGWGNPVPGRYTSGCIILTQIGLSLSSVRGFAAQSGDQPHTMPNTTDKDVSADGDAVELLEPTPTGRVTIPNHVLSHFDEGQRFYPVVQGGTIRLEPLKVAVPGGGGE